MNIVEGNPFFNKIEEKIQTPYLSKDISSDIVIIGAGITGLIIAYYLNKNNYNTVILEKSRIAYCSTSITTSLLQYELDDNINKLRSYFSKEELKEIYLECNKAITDLKEICNIINCKYEGNNSLLYTNKEVEKKEIKEEYEFRDEIGLNVRMVTKHSDELKYGILSIDSGLSFNPYEFCIKMTKYLLNKVSIYENTEVIKIDYDKNIIYTKYNYKVNFKKVIAATGYDLSLFNISLGKLSYTYNIVTNISNINSKLLVRDNKETYNYYRIHNNRVIAGGYDTPYYNAKEAEEIYEKLLRDAKKVYLNNDLKIEYKYSGLFNSTKDNLGYFGYKDNDKLLFALGYGANGIVYAILGANIIVDELSNKYNKLKKHFSLNR